MALNHIGIIMDGNGRWAQERGKPRSFGHRNAINAIKDVVNTSLEQQIPYLTLFCFSAQNWNRPKKEIDYLMKHFVQFLKKYKDKIIKQGIKVQLVGEREKLPANVISMVEELEKIPLTPKMTLILALSYGGQEDIVAAVNRIIADKVQTPLQKEQFAAYLQTAPAPELDLLIRTGGEKRISNFLLYQAAYAELYFTDSYWPDFNKQKLLEAIDYFNNRHRRFGGIK